MSVVNSFNASLVLTKTSGTTMALSIPKMYDFIVKIQKFYRIVDMMQMLLVNYCAEGSSCSELVIK
ncbi:hypothetical protein [Clostridium estertheticum]|uniref:hypothetical protein n=1 Tax=Clostridium estertheticum TaxID=238834 RepID=UPI001CF3E5FB|nr:hypothetical protein [Clostridium estertheticum]MCB2342548.1 hypothetical protein [Clostridium estertheticum]